MTATDPPSWYEATAARLMDECLDARQELAKLTPRQIEVARYVAKGFTNAAAAEFMGVKTIMVEVHMSDVFKRLGLRNRVELAVMVAKAGLS